MKLFKCYLKHLNQYFSSISGKLVFEKYLRKFVCFTENMYITASFKYFLATHSKKYKKILRRSGILRNTQCSLTTNGEFHPL